MKFKFKTILLLLMITSGLSSVFAETFIKNVSQKKQTITAPNGKLLYELSPGQEVLISGEVLNFNSVQSGLRNKTLVETMNPDKLREAKIKIDNAKRSVRGY